MARAEVFKETLGSLQLRGRRGGAKDPDPERPQAVGEPCHQGALGPDHDQAHIFSIAPTGDAEHVVDRLGANAPELLNSRVCARFNPKSSEAFALLELPGERVLAAAGTEEENIDSIWAAKFGHGGRTL